MNDASLPSDTGTHTTPWHAASSSAITKHARTHSHPTPDLHCHMYYDDLLYRPEISPLSLCIHYILLYHYIRSNVGGTQDEKNAQRNVCVSVCVYECVHVCVCVYVLRWSRVCVWIYLGWFLCSGTLHCRVWLQAQTPLLPWKRAAAWHQRGAT